jgi:hypothetical protein
MGQQWTLMTISCSAGALHHCLSALLSVVIEFTVDINERIINSTWQVAFFLDVNVTVFTYLVQSRYLKLSVQHQLQSPH